MPDLPDEITVGLRADNTHFALDGSEERPCIACGDPVIVSPATQEAIDSGQYPDEITCIDCATEEATEDD